MTEVSADSTGTERLGPLEQVLGGLPVPALVVDAAASPVTIALANDVFVRTFETPQPLEGMALTDLLDEERTVAVEGVGVGELLAAAVEDGRGGVTQVLVGPPVGGLASEEAARRWTVWAQPIDGIDGVVLLSFLDVTGQLLTSAQPEETSALQDLAAGLSAAKPQEQVYRDIARGSALVAGARRSAVLLSDGGATFRVEASTGEADLPDTLVVDDLASPVWRACLGRERLAWSSDDPDAGPPPLPFAGAEGWEHLLAVGLRLHGRWQGVLVVGEPRLGAFDPDALERLALVATLASTAVDNARLTHQFRQLEELLTAAVATSAALTESTDPRRVRDRLLHGLVEDMGLEGAALWLPEEGRRGRLTLYGAVGLPEDVRERIAELGPGAMATKLADGALSGRLREAATAAATSSWPDRDVRLVHVPDPASGVLGVYASRPLPELVDGVLATLAHGLANAVHQATLHERARTVVDSLQRELRPKAVALPAGVELGSVYQSATAGVEVGGDFIDWFLTDRGFVGVACGDVAGKGVEAASLTAMAVYSLRAFALQGTSAPMALRMINDAVARQTTTERFMTMAYARIDPATWTGQLGLAGHPDPVIVGPGGARHLGAVPDVPVGIDPSASFAAIDVALRPGEALVLYTDGVTEARSADGELLGAQRLLEVLDGLAGVERCSAQGLADGVWQAVRDWTDDGTTDDCAVVVLRRVPDDD